MKREYHKWWSQALERDMELLVFGHDGLPVVVFPTSQGRFYEFEDQGMVQAVADKVAGGRLQLICVDSVDAESWNNQEAQPDRRVARQTQYENYIVREVVPLIRQRNRRPHVGSTGCGFGGFHALNIALRHPDLFTGCLSMSGSFDLKSLGLLDGYTSEEAQLNQPLEYVPQMTDHHSLERIRRNSYILATGVHDHCWNDNERMAAAMREQGIPVRLDVWGDNAGHDWQWWQRMAHVYL